MVVDQVVHNAVKAGVVIELHVHGLLQLRGKRSGIRERKGTNLGMKKFADFVVIVVGKRQELNNKSLR